MAKPTPDELEIRPAEESDDPGVLDLFRRTLGWRDEDPNEDFFRWKHRTNPFGVSPAWLALHDGRVVGYRTFLRWRFLNDEGKVVRAVRAVDTATAPDYQGLGIFRTLTLRGVADLTLKGDHIVFNTPNDQSRPGYLKMGWSEARRLPIGILPRPGSLMKVVRARVPADLWSRPTSVGLDAADALADSAVADGLLTHSATKGYRTQRTPEYLAWRTSLRPLHYRLLLASERNPAKGGIIFRLRRRGEAVEAAVIEELVPNPLVGMQLVRRMLARTGADYAIGLRTGPSAGLIPVPIPSMGPLLTTRPLAGSPPDPKLWALTLGDVELF